MLLWSRSIRPRRLSPNKGGEARRHHSFLHLHNWVLPLSSIRLLLSGLEEGNSFRAQMTSWPFSNTPLYTQETTALDAHHDQLSIESYRPIGHAPPFPSRGWILHQIAMGDADGNRGYDCPFHRSLLGTVSHYSFPTSIRILDRHRAYRGSSDRQSDLQSAYSIPSRKGKFSARLSRPS